MGPTQPGSDWAFCKNEQEGPKVIIILFQIQLAWSFFSCKIKTKQTNKKTPSWGITLRFPSLSHLQCTPLGLSAREGAQGSWPFPLWPNITSSPTLSTCLEFFQQEDKAFHLPITDKGKMQILLRKVIHQGPNIYGVTT